MNIIEIYTDGSITKNPGGRGGFAWVILKDGKTYSGGNVEEVSTNNRAELLGIISALNQLNPNPDYTISIYSDSQYCVSGCEVGGYSSNKDLWDILIKELDRTKALVSWIPRRSCIYSKLADSLAAAYAFNHETKPTLEQIIEKENKRLTRLEKSRLKKELEILAKAYEEQSNDLEFLQEVKIWDVTSNDGLDSEED